MSPDDRISNKRFASYMSNSKVDIIAASLFNINKDYYTRYENGSQVHQTSAPEIIERMLRMLHPDPGDFILEIGTGSGYTTDLLSNIVEENGVITSIDIDANMVERANQLLQKDGYTNVRVLLGDGRIGQPNGSPYNRIIAWASAEYEVLLPLVEQLTSNGILVCPLRSKDSSWIASFKKNEAGNLEEIERISGGFIPMTGVPFYPWLDER
ncbi:methyltransferase domain-containing protein [Candidatus Gracilibacteria bacterium]|nr:methyltransferase domain-containing protein [Candidatus Gracilibacteria bacterium]NJM88731.1 methyltransferase domain-containing protein [Hydrococcus sp. RU_2_2]